MVSVHLFETGYCLNLTSKLLSLPQATSILKVLLSLIVLVSFHGLKVDCKVSVLFNCSFTVHYFLCPYV